MSKAKRKRGRRKTVSGALRETIRDRGLTAYGAAKGAGVSPDAVQRFLSRKRGLTLETVDKLAESLDLTLCPDEEAAVDRSGKQT